jgi:hypothetical protein
VSTASSGGCGAGAGFRAEPPDDAVCDAWKCARRLASCDGGADALVGCGSMEGGPKGASPKKFRYTPPPRVPRWDAGRERRRASARDALPKVRAASARHRRVSRRSSRRERGCR